MALGLILGLAVYNRVLLDFPMPLVVYKKVNTKHVCAWEAGLNTAG
jgi:hypothetical protein